MLKASLSVVAGSRLIGGRAPASWQLFIVATSGAVEFPLARSGQRLKNAKDIGLPDVRLSSLALVEARFRQLKRLQWVAVDQWEQGTDKDELEFIKQRIARLCLEQKLGCYYSF